MLKMSIETRPPSIADIPDKILCFLTNTNATIANIILMIRITSA